jgi:hypothetical protein
MAGIVPTYRESLNNQQSTAGVSDPLRASESHRHGVCDILIGTGCYVPK